LKDLFLAEPGKEYQRSFQDYALAYKMTYDTHYFDKYKKALVNFDEYLHDLGNYRKGLDLHEVEVATSTFWLIDNNEVVGVVRVRHQEIEEAGHIGYDISPCHRNKGYGKEILRLALQKAAALGIKEAILTCRTDNTFSRKIIEKNSGRLLGTFFSQEDNTDMYKYCICTSNMGL
jgi:predicted acetyltransferase